VPPIVTLTLNPAVDGSAEAEVVRPVRKTRTSNERYDPGGGGINVARVVQELGGSALAVYLGGGATGSVLDELLDAHNIPRRRVPIRDHTRVSHAVFERPTGLEYRFVPEGPQVSEEEWRACLATLDELAFDWLVASGSLPRGVPSTFYVEVARIAAGKRARFALDTSGEALRASLSAGGLYLVKPSLGELESAVERPLPDPRDQEAAASDLVRSGAVEILAATMGHHGALLTTREGSFRLRAPDVQARSTVGAGDSFLGAMTLALAQGQAPWTAFTRGVAAGTAAVLTPGTQLCRREEVERMHERIIREQPTNISDEQQTAAKTRSPHG
jgi:6-phosphofructokinase 2